MTRQSYFRLIMRFFSRDSAASKKYKVIFAASCTFLLSFSFSAVFAQESGTGITIRPSIFEEQIDPGETYTSLVRVTNNTGSAQVYYVTVRDIRHVSSAGTPVFADSGEETILGLAEWVTVPAGPIDVGADQTIEIPFTINVPEDASPGNHLGGIFVGPEAQELDQIGAGIGFKVVPLINIQITGDLDENARLRSFSTEKLLYGEPVVTFTTIVENLGNVAIKPRGPIEIENMFGKQVAEFYVNENEGLVPPYGDRIFISEWSDDEKVYLGRYTATVSLVYGQTDRVTIYRSVSFWILPMKIIIPVLATLLVVILGIYVIVKMYIRKNIRVIEEATGRTLKDSAREKAPMTRLAFITVVLLTATILFLMLMFVFVA